MAFSLNKIMLIGTLGKDGETRFTTNNKSVTSFSMVTEYGYKDPQGEWKNQPTWHNITVWEISDFLKDKLVKGAKVYVEGRLSKRDYTDKDGNKRFSVEVVSEKIIPLSGNQRESTGTTSEDTQESSSKNNVEDDPDSLPF